MSDPTNPIAPAAQEPAAAPPAAAAPSAPAPAAAAPQTPAEAPAKPAYVNPWKGRAPAPVAPAASAAPVAPPSPAPASQPASDPRIDALMNVLGETVAQDLSALPANVAATVRAIAGDDPVAQRKAINAMRANGLAVSPAAPLAPPASTTMPAAPVVDVKPAAAGSDDAARLTEYEKLSKVAPTIAAAYRTSHADSINRALAARTSAN